MSQVSKIELKTVSSNGQISIGKEFAGQQVQVIRQGEDSLVINKGVFIPNNEKWLYRGNNIDSLNKAISESKSRPHSDNFEKIKRRILEE